MTEAEWLDCTDLPWLISELKGTGRDRKLRLFACACVRRLGGQAAFARTREAVEVAERVADGAAPEHALARAYQAGVRAWSSETRQLRSVTAITGGMVVAFPQANLAARYAATNTPPVLVPPGATKRRARLAAERQLQLTLFRCIFGNPARPAPFDPRWRAPTARDLARAAYEERALPSGELDRARLTVLADALEEAGCADPDILSHLRGPGPHVRGCWVVDLLLGKA